MKVNKLEAHDRKEHLVKDQALNIAEGASNAMKTDLSIAYQDKSPYIYLFAFPKTNAQGNKVMYWQPRLSKPEAQDNSYLFRAISKTDELEVIWLLPPEHQWPSHAPGQVNHNDIAWWSINQFQFNKAELEKPDKDDMNEEKQKVILKSIIDAHTSTLKAKKLILKPDNKIIWA